MKAWWVCAALLLVTLAGCTGASDKPKAKPDAAFEDLDLKATATTGVLRGVVVDSRIAPIAGVDVNLGGVAQRNGTTDKDGRFAFTDLEPGTYIVAAHHSLYVDAQTTAEVLAGVDSPPVVKLQLERRFSQAPFHETYKHDGFIQCNQAGVYYASAPCVTDFTGIAAGPTGANQCVDPTYLCCKPAGCMPFLRRIQTEQRGFTVPLGAGWQTLIWEMVWKESSDTFDNLGITVSYNETERCACHNFGSLGGPSPLRMQIDLGVDFKPSNDVEPNLIPPEGLPAMYYFI